jgi:peptidoglycan hydrolase-like protein with peptidoglycan-binding domain
MAMARPTIQVGSKGQAVRDAQQALVDRGYYIGTQGVDGIFGAHTFAGVVSYQNGRSAGEFWAFSYPLAVDGIVGPQTWGRLAPDTIRNGDKGTGVRLAQNILKNYAYPPYDPGPVDGVFGPQTELAVTNFQNDVDITADGIVGPVTWVYFWS